MQTTPSPLPGNGAQLPPNTQPATPRNGLPGETPRTGFDASEGQANGADAGPMANFGFTVAAYAVLWVVLAAFLLGSWRKQRVLDARITGLEAAIAKGAPPVKVSAKRPPEPS